MGQRTRYAATRLPTAAVGSSPFHSSEEAWFWFIRCQLMRHQGARPVAVSGALARPCDPDDIYRAVIALHKGGVLCAAHLRTLSQYGLAERAPDERCGEEAAAARLWDEAMGALDGYLRGKGIVGDYEIHHQLIDNKQ